MTTVRSLGRAFGLILLLGWVTASSRAGAAPPENVSTGSVTATPANPASANEQRTPSASVPVEAGGRGEEGAAGGKELARALYEKGAKAYAERRYYEAASFFLDTNRIYPTPQLAFNVGKAYDKAGHATGALRHYREYLRSVPDAPDRAEVSARIQALELVLTERGLQQLSVLSKPEGATVSLDGRPVGVTPWTGETWPGRHSVTLHLAGYEPVHDLVEIDPHRAAETEVVLSRVAPVRDPKPRPSVPSERRPRVAPLTWIALGAGTLSLVTALTLEMSSSDTNGISRTSAFFAGVGLAGSAVGGVMLYLDMNALTP